MQHYHEQQHYAFVLPLIFSLGEHNLIAINQNVKPRRIVHDYTSSSNKFEKLEAFCSCYTQKSINLKYIISLESDMGSKEDEHRRTRAVRVFVLRMRLVSINYSFCSCQLVFGVYLATHSSLDFNRNSNSWFVIRPVHRT